MNRGWELKRETHPKDKASFLSLATFSYMFPFVRRGKLKDVEEYDIPKVMKKLNSRKVSDKLEKYWEESKKTNPEPSIFRALILCYGKALFILWIAQIFTSTLHTYSIPWALGKFVSYFEKNQTHISKQEALFYAMIMVLFNVIHGLWKQHYDLWKTELGLKIQASISSLLYRKALTLSQSKLNNVTTGNIVTGITKDVQCINHAMLFGMDTIADFVRIGFVSYLLYEKMQMASIGGITIVFLSLLCQIAIARFTYKKRAACNEKSDQRLKQTQEILSSIRLIKMYCWESFFEKRLLWLRKMELQHLYVVYMLKSLGRIIGQISEKIAHISTLLFFLWLGNTLNADIVYYTTKLFRKVARSMIIIPFGIQSISELMITLKRINRILLTEENNTASQKKPNVIKPEVSLIDADVQIENRRILSKINLKLKTGLTLLIGPSGSGKSSLLKTILEEYNITGGKKKIQGTISYSPQSPWLFPSSLKQNIIFGELTNVYKYSKILDICGLTHDITTFSIGDDVALTDCGANLSRGQQSRINLARALYKDSDIYLLDDSLASLDSNIQNHVFNNAIKDYLSNKLCILVTHSTQYVNQADNVIVLKDGEIKYNGEPNNIPGELLEQKDTTVDEILEICGEDSPLKKEIEEDENVGDEHTKLLSIKHQKDNTKKSCGIYSEVKKDGKVDLEIYKSYVRHGGGVVMLVMITAFHIICETFNGLSEKYMSKWLNAQGAQGAKPLNITTDAATTTTANKSYGFHNSILYNSNTTNMEFFDFFVGSTSINIFFSFFGAFVTFYYSIKIARNLHKSMASSLIRSCMEFFDTNLIGNVLTRFSRDLFMVEEFMPFIWQGLRTLLILGISLMLIATIYPLFAVLSLVMALMFYFISEYLLSTSRSLQRLIGSSLSPMLGHLNTTLDGLMIIRAHGTQEILKEEFDEYQDLFVTANHMKELTMKVMTFYCHLIESSFTAFVTIRLIYIQGILAGDAGLVLTQTTMLGHYIEWTLMMWMFVENSMTSVERIVEYIDLPPENNTGRDLQEDWPKKGEIKFENVSLSYGKSNDLTLKDLSFTIRPKEKIGIVGRTGAGKSSIILTLFKMYEFKGKIEIDDVDIKTLSLNCLRRHLAIIPQDPVIFSGTLRTNIDPFGTKSDEKLWSILDIVSLKSQFKDLDEDMTQKNLSIGQKQLISIARTLTKDTKIVILDEATANMDEEMDGFIHKRITELFVNCTVITIAHRIKTVMNSDKIIVMDDGKIVEFDSPENLLENNNSLFYKMVHPPNIYKENKKEK